MNQMVFIFCCLGWRNVNYLDSSSSCQIAHLFFYITALWLETKILLLENCILSFHRKKLDQNHYHDFFCFNCTFLTCVCNWKIWVSSSHQQMSQCLQFEMSSKTLIPRWNEGFSTLSPRLYLRNGFAVVLQFNFVTHLFGIFSIEFP